MTKLFILRLLWVLAIIIPFFILPFRWAIFAIIFVSILSPMMALIFYMPLRNYLINKSGKDYVSGAIESIVFIITYYFINSSFNAPKLFMIIIIIEYTINQLNRTYRQPSKIVNTDEIKELLGFYIMLSVFLIFSIIKNIPLINQ